jgi:hypothetical protein
MGAKAVIMQRAWLACFPTLRPLATKFAPGWLGWGPTTLGPSLTTLGPSLTTLTLTLTKGRSVGKRVFWQNVEYEHLAIGCMPCTVILSGFMHLFLVHAFHSCFLGINFFAKCARLPSTFHSTSIRLPFGHQFRTWRKIALFGPKFAHRNFDPKSGNLA